MYRKKKPYFFILKYMQTLQKIDNNLDMQAKTIKLLKETKE